MSLVYACNNVDPEEWVDAFARLMPELDVRIWPDFGNPEEVEFTLFWNHPFAILKQFPNLKVIFSLGAGVDRFVDDPDLPKDIPIVRMIDPMLRQEMTEYVALRVLHWHRGIPFYEAQQPEQRWLRHPRIRTADRKVGVMGLGVLGGNAAEQLVKLGFDVAGWSLTPKDLPGVTSFHGADALWPFLNRSEILVCLLPLTATTTNILNAKTFAALPAGSYVINCARGAHLVDDDLIAALDSGHLGGAALDVFRAEPLLAEHPFWTHPKISVSPHIAALTVADTAMTTIIENIHRSRRGQPIPNVLQVEKGY